MRIIDRSRIAQDIENLFDDLDRSKLGRCMIAVYTGCILSVALGIMFFVLDTVFFLFMHNEIHFMERAIMLSLGIPLLIHARLHKRPQSS